ncbi:MAG TPA: Gfo/Idh/MocA family oxidoreductase [Chitinophagales bacterium]|nr:Gfo/Idh/MocA family oxidoreductase [Chitinophagales bacterium]
MNVAIIGFGYWGPNLLRNFLQRSDCEVKLVCDLRPERLKMAKTNYPAVCTVNSPDDVFKDKMIDAVCIATPAYTHYELAKKALQNGKHVLIEKPMTSTTAEADTLINLALRKKKVLLVDHTFLYTGAVKAIKLIVESGTIGKIKYFDSTRINLGLFQPDINVLWDLAPHDISILNYLVKEKPVSLNATGISHNHTGLENIAYLTLNYKSSLIAHFSCSWTSPVKIRKILIGGSNQMILFDDVEPTEKVKVYDTSYDIKPHTDETKRQLLVDYRVGDIYIPKLEKTEALAGVVEDFVMAVTKGEKPLSDMHDGLEVVKILEAADKSIKSHGKEVKLL